MMQFTVLPVDADPPSTANDQTFLVQDNWNDWWQYQTQFFVIYVDEVGKRVDIGYTKIGMFDMPDGGRTHLQEQFTSLPPKYYSLGQTANFYENLTASGAGVRDEVLAALQDVAFFEERIEQLLNEDCFTRSLLRDVSVTEAAGQFNRLAHGGVALTPFDFTFQTPASDEYEVELTDLDFAVVPKSLPPSNLHVLIGRNGVGKTHLLANMSRSLSDPLADHSITGHFIHGHEQFSNVVAVSFSAFDRLAPIANYQNRKTGLKYSYIGLKRFADGLEAFGDSADERWQVKSPADLSKDFQDSVLECTRGPRLERWLRALESLRSDPIFDGFVQQINAAPDEGGSRAERAVSLFNNRLSSGHAIVLLTITRLVEKVEEKSLVLIDEPENHLHPPLISAFTRALADLLINRNGVGIIATHSPVILQEVPASCVWILNRFGNQLVAERPSLESFGENVGILTHEVFGLEVMASGFFALLRREVEHGQSLRDIEANFDHALGGEARAILMGLVAAMNLEKPGS